MDREKQMMIKALTGLVIVVILMGQQTACVTTKEPQNQARNIKSILSLGDSYTIGESVDESNRWPVHLKNSLSAGELNIDLKIIAKTGWRTDDLRKAVDETEISKKYDLVTLLIGVNNQYQNKPISEYPKEFELCLKQAISFANDRRDVLVVSIPDYAYTPFGQTKNPIKISNKIDKYNRINKSIAEEYGIKYVHITDITRKGINDPELVAKDGLHPSGKAYRQFIPRILKSISGK